MTPPTDQSLIDEAARLVLEHGSVRAAAKASGMPRTTMRRRYAKSKIDPAIQDSMAAVGTQMIPQLAWAKTKSTDGTSYSVMLKPDPIQDDVLDRIREALEGMAPARIIPAPKHVDGDLATIIPIYDFHIGARATVQASGEDYDIDIAKDRIETGVSQCLASSPASGLGILINGGDWAHHDDDTNATPKNRHVLDVTGRHYQTAEACIETAALAIELMLHRHKKVIYESVPGNHDPKTWMLMMFALSERFRDNPRVSIRKSPVEFFAFPFGDNLICGHHGHKRNVKDLVMFFAAEHSELWGQTKRRVLFTGHSHHLKILDLPGITCEQVRPVTPRDHYAASSAYHAMSEIQAITYHKRKGEVARVKVSF